LACVSTQINIKKRLLISNQGEAILTQYAYDFGCTEVFETKNTAVALIEKKQENRTDSEEVEQNVTATATH
jgi:hypothetical protein